MSEFLTKRSYGSNDAVDPCILKGVFSSSFPHCLKKNVYLNNIRYHFVHSFIISHKTHEMHENVIKAVVYDLSDIAAVKVDRIPCSDFMLLNWLQWYLC